jgi:hypothetical protein
MSPGQHTGTGRAGSPWEQRDAVFFVVACGLGLVALVASWYGSSTSDTAEHGWAWFNLGVAGLTLAGIAYVVWFLRGRRAVGIARALLLPEVLAAPEVEVRVTAGPDAVVAGPGMSRFHRVGCAFVAGRPTEAASRAQLVDSGLCACEICEP